MKAFFSLIFISLVTCKPSNAPDQDDNISEIKMQASQPKSTVCEKCMPEGEADTAFVFSNNKKVLICSDSELLADEKYYSEFSLFECGADSITEFWGATENYTIAFEADTLKLKNYQVLALGNNFELVDKEWLTEYFYFDNNKLTKKIKINPLVKYNQDQVKQTLTDYEKTNWQTQNSALTEAYSDEKMALANKLMISAISGNTKAEAYFKEFEKKFQPDGAFAEWYGEMAAMLALAKQRK